MSKSMHSEAYWLKCATTPLVRAGCFGGDACVGEKRTIASDLTERLDAAVKEVGQSPERRFERMTIEQELAVREYVGEEKGKKAKNVSSVKSLMKTMGLSMGAAMDALEFTAEERLQTMEALKD